MRKVLIVICWWGALVALPAQSLPPFGAADYVKTLKKVTDLMLADVTSPVAASRYYAYINLTAYETQSVHDAAGYPSLSGRLNGLQPIALDRAAFGPTDAQLAAILAILKSGEKLLPSGYLLKNQVDSLAVVYEKQQQTALFQNTLQLVEAVWKPILGYVRADGFSKLNNLRRYTPKSGDAYWQPTPPAFMAPVEPYWNTIRPFALDSAQQFKVAPPAPYDTARTSSFYRQLREVYDISQKATKKQRQIAQYWDCNPFAVQQIGHVEFGLKKISPGGHWIGITGIACKKQHFTLAQTAHAHAMVSIALADAFIACWDEKYRSNRVRPETAIKKLIDPRWQPLLQTPPFPEYVSGHSVASTAAALVLTRLFGDPFSFTDDTEVEFHIPARKFKSFHAAAEEACISRLYGGIHYRDAIVNGQQQGEAVGNWVVKKFF
jgi:hypothetical protein